MNSIEILELIATEPSIQAFWGVIFMAFGAIGSATDDQ